MANEGWIKLHRKIQDCWVWEDKPFSKGQAWIDLIMTMQHHDKKMLIDEKPTVIKRGSYMFSILKLSEKWGWSRNKVKRFLDTLESEQMLHTRRTNKGTLITVVNYGEYQGLDEVDEPTDEPPNEPTFEPPGEPQNKNVKNVKNVNNNIMSISAINALFEELWLLYPRKKGKGQISDAKKRKIADVGKEQMIRAIDRYKRYVSTQKDLSYQYGSTFFNSGYIDYLDENYVEKDEQPKKTNRTSFNNFESRSYDMRDLEQQLLGKG